MKKLNTILLLVTIAIFASACTTNNSHTNKAAIKTQTLLFDFEDFGPPSMSFEILGDHWWSWEPSGSPNPNEQYPIRVVVYQDIELETVKNSFPISVSKKNDYRYLNYEQAISYLEKQIQENVIPVVTQRLKKTKEAMQSNFLRAKTRN